jgi:DNA-directed RNA polymerase subunit RPC12/RpoP
MLHFVVAVYLHVESFGEKNCFTTEDIVTIFNTDKRGQHIPEKPFTCIRCGRRYKRKASLNSHLANECGKEPQFHCPQCSYRCKVKSNFLRHFRAYHTTMENSGVVNSNVA